MCWLSFWSDLNTPSPFLPNLAQRSREPLERSGAWELTRTKNYCTRVLVTLNLIFGNLWLVPSSAFRKGEFLIGWAKFWINNWNCAFFSLMVGSLSNETVFCLSEPPKAKCEEMPLSNQTSFINFCFILRKTIYIYYIM